VWGLYLPNTPNNVWNTSVNRSGEAVDGVLRSATEPAKLKAYGTSKIKGTLDVDMEDVSYTGSFQTTFDKVSLDGGLDVTLKSSDGVKKELGAKVLSQVPEGGLYPDVYFQLTGLKDLGLDDYIPNLSSYDNKWIFISSETFKEFGDGFGFATGDNTERKITAADIAEIVRAGSAVTKEYVFSTAADKAVFVKKSFVGKEKENGITAYHYKVGINKQHAKDYCVALTNAIYGTKGYQKITGLSDQELKTEKADEIKTCKEQTGDVIKGNDTFDMWMDGHYKLIYKVRLYAEGDKNSYIDLGQLYKGGDQLSLFALFHDATAKGDGRLTAETNIKTNNTKMTFNYKEDGDMPYEVKATLEATVSDDKVTITKPANAVPFMDILKQYGLDSYYTGVQSRAKNTETEVDLYTLQSYIEVAFVNNDGSYPTLAQLNDPVWRQTNMKGMDAEALTPAGSTSTQLAATATAAQYGYTGTPAGCDGAVTQCSGYTLTAKLQDGTTMTLDSN